MDSKYKDSQEVRPWCPVHDRGLRKPFLTVPWEACFHFVWTSLLSTLTWGLCYLFICMCVSIFCGHV